MMKLAKAPAHGEFTFVYKSMTIIIPAGLNDVARHKPKTFWNWLLFRYPFDSSITLTLQDIIDEENT